VLLNFDKELAVKQKLQFDVSLERNNYHN